MGLQLPQLPLQSVPIADNRGGDPALPNLFARAWWLYFNAITSFLSGLLTQFTALQAAVAGGSGIIQATQSQLAGLSGLSVGSLVEVTDYQHVLRWTGSAFTWGPGDSGSGMIQFFDVAPSGVGWKLVDGNGDDGMPIGAGHPIKILKEDGTTRSNTTAAAMNVAGGVFMRAAATYNGAVTAKTAPSIGAPTASVNVLSSSSTSVATGGHVHVATVTAPPVDYVQGLPYIRK